MEKKYIKPELEITYVNNYAIIATSIKIADDDVHADPDQGVDSKQRIYDLSDIDLDF